MALCLVLQLHEVDYIFKVCEKLLIDHGLSLISSHRVHLANLHHIVCCRTVWYGRGGRVSLLMRPSSVISYCQFTSVNYCFRTYLVILHIPASAPRNLQRTPGSVS